jgi:hypothetical protein
MQLLKQRNKAETQSVSLNKIVCERRYLTNKNYIHEETECSLKSGDSYHNLMRDLFSASLPIQKYKNQDKKNCNFACCFLWLWSFVPYVEDVQECGAEEDIWA